MKFLLTKDMYVKFRTFDGAVDTALHCNDDVILCVEGAYRVVDGKAVVVSLDEVGCLKP